MFNNLTLLQDSKTMSAVTRNKFHRTMTMDNGQCGHDDEQCGHDDNVDMTMWTMTS